MKGIGVLQSTFGCIVFPRLGVQLAESTATKAAIVRDAAISPRIACQSSRSFTAFGLMHLRQRQINIEKRVVNGNWCPSSNLLEHCTPSTLSSTNADTHTFDVLRSRAFHTIANPNGSLPQLITCFVCLCVLLMHALNSSLHHFINKQLTTNKQQFKDDWLFWGAVGAATSFFANSTKNVTMLSLSHQGARPIFLVSLAFCSMIPCSCSTN